MSDFKSILQSRTVWSNAIGFSAFTLSHFGLNVASLDQTQIIDSVLQIITASSFISSSLFRIFAVKRLV